LITQGAADLNCLLEGHEDRRVLVPPNSFGTPLEMRDEQAPALGERFRLLHCDTRGRGASPAPPGPYAIDDLGWDVLSLLDRIGVESAPLSAASIGGMTGMWLAGEAPERIERLVLLCTSAPFRPQGALGRAPPDGQDQGTGALVDGAIERWFTPAFCSENPEAVEQIARALRATPRATPGAARPSGRSTSATGSPPYGPRRLSSPEPRTRRPRPSTGGLSATPSPARLEVVPGAGPHRQRGASETLTDSFWTNLEAR
jgi:pimeloyl-ACP methyl ester carboxylesterase